VRTVAETIAETGERSGVVARVARQLGIGEQTLRSWVPSHRAHRGMTPAEFAEAWTINRQLQLA
jgi:transposase-like protein